MKGVLRVSVAVCVLIFLLYTRSRLAALLEYHYILHPSTTSASKNAPPAIEYDTGPQWTKDHTAVPESRPSQLSGAAGDKHHFAAVLGSIVKSLENVSTIEHEPSFRQTRDKIVVMGKLKDEDTDWVGTELPDWPSAIYTVDDMSALLHTERNKGKEANAYLTYIIDNYDRLPSVIAFVHSHHKAWPQSWHTDAAEFSNARSLKALNTDFVQENGYVNLRCQSTPGCPQEIQPLRKDEKKATEVIFAEAWRALFNNTNVPSVIGVACCAQFAVAREQVLQRSRDEYIWYHRWLLETELADDISGRVFEYLYHIIFGKDPVYCPPVADCYRDVYRKVQPA